MNWVIFSLFFPLWSSYTIGIEKCTYIWCGLKNISSPFLARGHSLSFSRCHASVVGSVGHIKLWNCWATLLTQLCRTMQIALLEILKSHFYYRSFVGESGWKRQLVSYLLPLGGDVVLLVTVNLLLNPRAFLSAVFEWVCQKINKIGFLHSFASFSLLSFWSV